MPVKPNWDLCRVSQKEIKLGAQDPLPDFLMHCLIQVLLRNYLCLWLILSRSSILAPPWLYESNCHISKKDWTLTLLDLIILFIVLLKILDVLQFSWVQICLVLISQTEKLLCGKEFTRVRLLISISTVLLNHHHQPWLMTLRIPSKHYSFVTNKLPFHGRNE